MHGTTYLDFCKFVEELDGKVYDEQNKTYSMKAYPLSTKNLKLKLYLRNLLGNMRTNCFTLDLVTKFRNRETKVWSNTSIKPCDLPAFLDHQQRRLNKSETVSSDLTAKVDDDIFVQENTKEQDLVSQIQELRMLTNTQSANKFAKTSTEQAYIANTANNLERLHHLHIDPAFAVIPMHDPISPVFDSSIFSNLGSINPSSIWKELLQNKKYDTLSNQLVEDPKLKSDANIADVTLDNFLTDVVIWPDQRAYLQVLFDHAKQTRIWKNKLASLPSLATKRVEVPKQLLHLLLGGPGSGKTWITQIFTEVLDYFELKVKKYAFTGIAATLMQDAVTFNSGLFIPVPKKGESTNQKIAPLCSVTNTAACSFVQVEYEDIDYIVLDELSMMDGTQIGNISDRLNEVKHPY